MDGREREEGRERERLQRIAYGPGSSAEDAAEAVLALGRLGRPAAVASPGTGGSGLSAGSGAGAGAGAGPGAGAGVVAGAGVRAEPAPGAPGRTASIVRALLLHPVALVVGTAVVAFLLGGLATNLLRTGPPVADGPRSSVAEQTSLARILPRSQTDADRLPAALRSDMQPDTARLLFANGADSPSTPWEAWVVRRTDGELCFIASPDRRATTSSCVPASVAFGSSVSLVARARSDVLTVRVDRGGVEVVLVGRT